MRFLFSFLFILSSHVFTQTLQKPVSTNSNNENNYKVSYNYIAVNNIKMWIGNDGIGSHNPVTDGSGFYWPGGEEAINTSIFTDGLIFGAKLNEEILFGGSMYSSTLQAGKVVNNEPDDALLEKYRVYKINRYWKEFPPGPERESRMKDYVEWPIEDGAPYEDVNGDGKPTPGVDKPKFLGDETLWYVANDLNFPALNPSITFTGPLGIEIQITVFGYNRINILGDVVFKKYKLINKGSNYLEDMYISCFSDADLGSADDDFVGCDTSLNLGYTWNSDNVDGNGSGRVYGTPPPAVGYTIIQGPAVAGTAADSILQSGKWVRGKRSLGMTAFVNDIEMTWIPVERDFAYYSNLIQGRTWDGYYFKNPVTGETTTKILSGDPVTGTGWYEGDGWPGGPYASDRRMHLCSGPLNFAPGDTQEVVYAIHMAKGTSNISSISFLKEQSKRIKEFYLSEFSKPEIFLPLKLIPEDYVLEQNYPNPFNPETKILYSIPFGGNVKLKVYDVLGNEVAVLVDEDKPAGSYEVTWNAVNISAGAYFYQIDTMGFVRTRKMILIK